MPTPPRLPGRKGHRSLFRDKDRTPFSVTLTTAHHAKLADAVMRLTHALQWQTRDPTAKVTRNDVIALLIECYADTVELPTEPPAPSAA